MVSSVIEVFPNFFHLEGWPTRFCQAGFVPYPLKQYTIQTVENCHFQRVQDTPAYACDKTGIRLC